MVIFVHLLFILSYYIDLQILEGNLSGSRFFFRFSLNRSFYDFASFCKYTSYSNKLNYWNFNNSCYLFNNGWKSILFVVCPYTILGEISEKLHRYLKKKLIKSYKFNHNIKYIFWAIFLFLAFVSGYLVFEIINVVGIISRALIYGYSVAFSICSSCVFD